MRFFLCKDDKVQWLKISLISIGVMVLCGLPWIMALHNKYGIWTTSTSGTLNTSWYLVGHPQWKDGIGALIPPAYKDSPYYWEDPYMANGATPHFWNSWHLFGLQLVRIGLNLWKLLKSMLQLSVLFIFSANLFLRAVVNKKDRSPSIYINVVARSFILFPLGYLLVNFEPRYIWYMLPLGMLLGGLFFQNFVKHKGRQDLMFFIYIFAFSFLIYPVWCMADMYHEGKNEYAIAQQLKKLHIQGSFTGVAEPGKGAQRIERMAYFSGNSYYSIPAKDVQQAEILKEMRRYHVKYYFAYTSYPGYRTEAFDPIFTDEEGKPFPEVTNGSINGLRVFLVNQ